MGRLDPRFTFQVEGKEAARRPRWVGAFERKIAAGRNKPVASSDSLKRCQPGSILRRARQCVHWKRLWVGKWTFLLVPRTSALVSRLQKLPRRGRSRPFGFVLPKSISFSHPVLIHPAPNSRPSHSLRSAPQFGFWLCPRRFVSLLPSAFDARAENNRDGRYYFPPRGSTRGLRGESHFRCSAPNKNIPAA